MYALNPRIRLYYHVLHIDVELAECFISITHPMTSLKELTNFFIDVFRRLKLNIVNLSQFVKIDNFVEWVSFFDKELLHHLRMKRFPTSFPIVNLDGRSHYES